jgi:flagellar basal body rod protein FlgG
MISGIGASLAGLAVFEKKLSAAANNIANSNTAGYKKTESVITEDGSGLPELSLQQVDTPGPLVQEADGKMSEQSNVDLAEELTQSIVAQRGYEANLKALRAQNDLLGKALDILV